jgi:thiol-disulfide isomerase/thioredoxin
MKRIVWGILALAALVFVLVVRNSLVMIDTSGQTNYPAQTDSLSASTRDDLDEETIYVSTLRDYGPAPELTNESWLNVDRPLRLAALRGKVVLLDMWTFDCINCIHVIPSVRDWYKKYSNQGLVVIANHFPEFSFERDIVNLRAAMERLDMPYAVAQDNDGATWNAYNNRYWPTIYLIDKQGHLRYQHIGEGAYEITEQAIQALLKETYNPPAQPATRDSIASLRPNTDLNVRSGPDAGSPVIGSVQEGEVFVVRGEENGWYRIQYNDQEGYVSGENVTVTAT